MNEKMCDWCKVAKASVGLSSNNLRQLVGERYCSDCDPYAWAAFVDPDTYEDNKRFALLRVERRLFKEAAEKASPKGIASSDEVTKEWLPASSRWVKRNELVAARIAFAVMFVVVVVAVVGIYLVGGKC